MYERKVEHCEKCRRDRSGQNWIKKVDQSVKEWRIQAKGKYMWIQEADEKEKETRYKKKGKILRQVKRYG